MVKSLYMSILNKNNGYFSQKNAAFKGGGFSFVFG